MLYQFLLNQYTYVHRVIRKLVKFGHNQNFLNLHLICFPKKNLINGLLTH